MVLPLKKQLIMGIINVAKMLSRIYLQISQHRKRASEKSPKPLKILNNI